MIVLDKVFEKGVLNFFAEISKIPRGSGNEKAVSDFVAGFARERGAEVYQDELFNLIIKKGATEGFEGREPVMLQAHLDMVCEKNAGTEFDFEKDAIDLYVEGDFVKARGTTLGADNGIGVALCMALIDGAEGLSHPRLEILLTADEEAGMTGAMELDISGLESKRMINLDSSDDDIFTMGCAAGATAVYGFFTKYDENEKHDFHYEVRVSGLKGGHSGVDIHLERGNALKILAGCLNEIDYGAFGMNLIDIKGGMKVNAIPREASATFGWADDSFVFPLTFEEAFIEISEKYKKHHKNTDPDLKIELIKLDDSKEYRYLTRELTEKIIYSLMILPSGVIANSLEIEGLVNASNNVGVIEVGEQFTNITSMMRGMTDFYNEITERTFLGMQYSLDTELKIIQRSPAWPYNSESELLKVAQRVFVKQNKREAKVTAVHAGLECAIFSSRFREEKGVELDIISFSANSYDYHTPDEKLSISSVERVWVFLQELLKEI